MHTFTISYVTDKDTSYFMATEHFSHAKFEIFDKIEDVTLFILWKFARVLDDLLSHEHQVNFAIVHTTQPFVSVVELRKALKESKKNIVSRWQEIYAIQRPRRARGKGPINYSDDKQNDIQDQADTLATGDNDSESVEVDPNSEKDDTHVPVSVFEGKNFLDEFDDDTFCYHPSFIGTTNDESIDPDSLQEEALVSNRIPVDDPNYLEEFSPLDRQYCTPLSIPKLPVFRSELCNSLALDKWKKHFSKNAFSINREVRVAKSSSQISAGEIDVNVISEATSKKIKSSNPEHVVYHEPDHCTDQSVSNSDIGKTFHNQLSTNQYNPRQQFLGEDRNFLKKIQLSDVYSDDDLQNEGVSIDHFRDDIVHLHHRLHCISSDLELDLFNKSVILSGKSFTSTHDDIELQVYSDLPTTYLMCCSDISKAPSLVFECFNIARKSFEYEKDDAYCKYITNVMQCKEKNLSFLGFVTMHRTEKDQNVLSSFTIQSFVLYSDMQSFTMVSVGHTCSSLYVRLPSC